MERERQGNKYYVPWKSVFVRRFYLRRRCRIVSSLLTKQLIDGLSDWLLRLPFWPIGRQFWLIIYVTDWTLTISSVHSYVCLPSDFDWQFKRATPSFASSTSLISPQDFLIRLMTWNLKGQFQNKMLKRRSNKELIYSRLQTTRKADKKKFSENHARATRGSGRERELKLASIVFNTSLRYPKSWYTLWLVSFCSFRQHLRQSLAFAHAKPNKHGERMKPSFTTDFAIWTRETVFVEVGGPR